MMHGRKNIKLLYNTCVTMFCFETAANVMTMHTDFAPSLLCIW